MNPVPRTLAALVACLVTASVSLIVLGATATTAKAAKGGTIGGARTASAPCIVDYQGKAWTFYVAPKGSLQNVRCAMSLDATKAPAFSKPAAVGTAGAEAAASCQRPHAVVTPDGDELYVVFGSDGAGKKRTGTLHYVSYRKADRRGAGDLVIPKSPVAPLVAVGDFGVAPVPGGLLVTFMSPLRPGAVVLARYLFQDREDGRRPWNARSVAYVNVPRKYSLILSTPRQVASLGDALKATGSGISSVHLPTTDAAGRTRMVVGLATRSADAGAKYNDLLFGEVTLAANWREATAVWDHHAFRFSPDIWETLPFSAPHVWNAPDGSIWATYSADRKGVPFLRFARRSSKANTWKLLDRADLRVDGWGLATGVFPSKRSNGLAVFVDPKNRLAYKVLD